MGSVCTNMMVEYRASRDASARKKRKTGTGKAQMEDRRGHGKIKQTGGSGAGSASSVGGATRASSFEAWQDQSLDKSVSGSSQRGGDRVERRSKSYDKAEAHVAAAAAATSVSPALTRNGKSKSMDRMRKTGPPKGKSLGSMKMTREQRAEERQQMAMEARAPVPLPEYDKRFRDESDRKKYAAMDRREAREERIRAICKKLKLRHDEVKAEDIGSREMKESEYMEELKELLEERKADVKFKPGIINNSW